MVKKKSNVLIDKKNIRLDGRELNELRNIKIDVGVLDNANGSAYLEQGKTKIMAGVYGPSQVHPRHLELSDRCLLRCRYSMAPFSVNERKSPAPSRRDTEISMVITNSLIPSLFLEYYPRTSIDVYLSILQADGGTRCAAITAASLALADAGIPMRDMVVAVAAGKVEGRMVLDLDDSEDKLGEADVPLALMPNTNKITLLQANGILTVEEFEKVLHLAIEGCKQIYVLQKDALMAKYSVTEEEKD